MARYLIQSAASHRIDEIYQYTLSQWGVAQADNYIIGMFDTFSKIETHEVLSRSIPADFGVDGFFCRYEKHFIYWRYLSSGDIGIVTILRERMHQVGRLKEDFGTL
ncbi:plasmid stabilization protein [Geothermobacter hydrogeniphilus]|uniref:Plasmid stabilization protein n=1 Tax=Geothermobacter hydrogeniphilus TaxID=1969733 RepID=A0A2K2H9F1_9BACT|nr:type II toxin-antitoxin system RelE/ParE family toxin [Geothermobacter hydrogeniphilus]PNU19934.1 plasmid stabilization protein [Geothermobacter hydrogeniphilus]